MQLTELQKQICKKIQDQLAYEINDFLAERYDYFLPVDKNLVAFDSYYGYTLTDSKKNAWEAKQSYPLKAEILEFLSLVQALIDANLVLQVPRKRLEIFPIFRKKYLPDQRYFPDDDFLILIETINNIQIASLPSFALFIKNDFKTESEIQTEMEAQNNARQIEILTQQATDERNARIADESRHRESFNFTKKIAWASLIVSAVSILVSIVNIFTYTTNRDITISKGSAFPDTTRVLILDKPVPTKQDSLPPTPKKP